MEQDGSSCEYEYKFLFKEIDMAEDGKKESCIMIKYGTVKIALGENNVRKTCKEYFEDVYKTNTEDQGIFNMCV